MCRDNQDNIIWDRYFPTSIYPFMLYQRILTVRFCRYFIWKHYQNLSFRILRNDNVFSLFLNRNREVWQVTRSMFRIVFGYFLQINSVIIRLVWLTSLSGIRVNIIQIWIRFFQIESGGLITFIYRPVKHKCIISPLLHYTYSGE